MAIFNVSNHSQLMSALQNASGGDEIRLASGDYGELDLRNVSFNSEVTITSANNDSPASFSELSLNNVSNLSFDNLVFDYDFSSGDKLWDAPFQVKNSSDINVENSVFSGDLASGTGEGDGFGTGRGLVVTGSSDVTVSNNEFFDWWKAGYFADSNDLNISNNDIHSIRSDGLNFYEVQDVLIEDNHIHDFDGLPNWNDHRDMIQIWTTNTDTPTTDVTIRGNTFDVGDGIWTQTIFARNIQAERGHTDLFYQNITIEDNTIYNSHLHGITIGATDGLIVRNNTLIHAGDPADRTNPGSQVPPQINVAEESKNVLIAQNVAADFIGFEGQSSWVVRDNVEIQNTDPGAAGSYGNVFEAASINTGAGEHNFVVKEGSVIDLLNAGSSATLNDEPSSASNQTPGMEEPENLIVEPVPVGQETQPPVVEPVPVDEEPEGIEPVDEEIPVINDVPVDRGDIVIDDFVLDIAALGGSRDLKRGAEVEGAGSEASLILDGGKSHADLGRLEEFETSQQLSFSIEFSRDSASEEDQFLVWNHRKFGVRLEDDGLRVQVANNDGPFWKGFSIDDLGLDDTDTHTLTVIADAESDRLQIIVDDQLVLDESNTDLDFVGAGGREWGWTVGGRWGGSFEGEVNDFRIEADADFWTPSTQDDGAFITV